MAPNPSTGGAHDVALPVEPSSEEFTLDVELKKLDLQENSVIVVKVPRGTEYNQFTTIAFTMNQLLESYRKINVHCLLIYSDVDLSTMDEVQMQKIGWIREKPLVTNIVGGEQA